MGRSFYYKMLDVECLFLRINLKIILRKKLNYDIICTNKGDKLMKKVFLWVIGIFCIITFLVYVNQIILPSILILITGIILLPPINERIKNKLQDEEKVKKYKIIRNIVVIVFILIFRNECTYAK